MKKIISLIIALSNFLTCSLCYAQTAYSENETAIYVATTGSDDGDGSINSPFATFERAVEEVRKLNDNMDKDITVYFREGTYRPKDTVYFTQEDGGTNGYFINYKSYPGEKATISGGIPVTNWKKQGNLWYSDIEGVERVGQLYVNDRRAQRARSSEVIEIEELFKLPDSKWKYDGISVKDTKYAAYKNPEDMQLHFGGRGWRSYLLSVTASSEVGNTTRFEIYRDPFNRATETEASASNWYPILDCHTFWLENAFEELDEKGEFYYDRPTKRLYYMPRDDEDMTKATVELATLDKMIDICGTDANSKVHNIRFDSLTLAHCSWERALRVGHVGDQAQDMYPDEGDLGVTLGYRQVPGNIHVSYAKNVMFTNNIIKDMGAVAIALFAGAENCKIEGNVFKDIGDGAISIGSLEGANEDIKPYKGKNIAAGKPTSACSTLGYFYMPTLALDQNDQWGWSPSTYSDVWWQVDLLEPMQIDRVEIDARKDADQQGGMEIVASNDPSFEKSTIIGLLPSQFPEDGTAVIRSRTSQKFRYVRIRKNEYFFLNNVRVINESMEYAPSYEVCKNNLVKNNVITRVGNTNFGAPGVTAYWTQGTNITHNHIYDVPYSGVSLGWGWSDRETISRDNRITYNHIEDIQKITYDAGAIYVMSRNPNSLIRGNYANNGHNPGVAIYQDSGSNDFTIIDNVSENFNINFHLSYVGGGYAKWRNNFTGIVTSDIAPTTTSDWVDPTYFIPGAYPTEAIEIMKEAGLEEGYEHLLDLAGKNYWPISVKDMYNGMRTDYHNTGMSYKKILSDFVGFLADDGYKWLEMAESGFELGQFPPEEIEIFKNTLSEIKTYFNTALEVAAATGVEFDRDEMVVQRIKLDKARERFLNSRVRVSFDEAIKMAEKALLEETYGTEIGMVGEKQYRTLEKALNDAKTEPDGKYVHEYLEQAILELYDSRLTMSIKSATIDNQLGDAIIDSDNKIIEFTVSYGTDLTKLKVNIKTFEDLVVTPDETVECNFTNDATYTIKTQSGISSSEWTVKVKEEPITQSDTPYDFNNALKENGVWFEYGSNNNKTYNAKRFGDIELDFDMKINNAIVNDWPCLVVRSQEYDMSFDSVLNSSYVFVFGKDYIEFHRFNNGVRTQFYGPVAGVTTIFGEALKTDAFKFGEKNKVKLTTRNEGDGVRIILNINGKDIINVLDNYEGAIKDPGYIGTVSPNSPITLGE